MGETVLYAGVDGGATKTQAVVVNAAGAEMGRATAGGANYQAIGVETAMAHVRDALAGAVTAAGGALPIAAARIGLAGIDRPADHAMLLPLLAPLAAEVTLSNDAELGLAALRGGYGITVIAGTGSIALGHDPHGNTARAGGWGHVIGDEGSGYMLGRQALQAAAQAADGRGPQTALLPLILEAWHIHDATEFIGKVYPATDKAMIAALSGVVFKAANAEDPIAQRILRTAAIDLTRTILAVAEKLDFGATLPLALVGGLVTREEGLRRAVLRRVRRHYSLGQVAIVHDPAVVAAHAARLAAIT